MLASSDGEAGSNDAKVRIVAVLVQKICTPFVHFLVHKLVNIKKKFISCFLGEFD